MIRRFYFLTKKKPMQKLKKKNNSHVVGRRQALWMCWISNRMCWQHAPEHHWQCKKLADRHIVLRLWLDYRWAIAPLWINYATEISRYQFALLAIWNNPWDHQVTYTWLLVAIIDSVALPKDPLFHVFCSDLLRWWKISSWCTQMASRQTYCPLENATLFLELTHKNGLKDLKRTRLI